MGRVLLEGCKYADSEDQWCVAAAPVPHILHLHHHHGSSFQLHAILSFPHPVTALRLCTAQSDKSVVELYALTAAGDAFTYLVRRPSAGTLIHRVLPVPISLSARKLTIPCVDLLPAKPLLVVLSPFASGCVVLYESAILPRTLRIALISSENQQTTDSKLSLPHEFHITAGCSYFRITANDPFQTSLLLGDSSGSVLICSNTVHLCRAFTLPSNEPVLDLAVVREYVFVAGKCGTIVLLKKADDMFESILQFESQPPSCGEFLTVCPFLSEQRDSISVLLSSSDFKLHKTTFDLSFVSNPSLSWDHLDTDEDVLSICFRNDDSFILYNDQGTLLCLDFVDALFIPSNFGSSESVSELLQSLETLESWENDILNELKLIDQSLMTKSTYNSDSKRYSASVRKSGDEIFLDFCLRGAFYFESPVSLGVITDVSPHESKIILRNFKANEFKRLLLRLPSLLDVRILVFIEVDDSDSQSTSTLRRRSQLFEEIQLHFLEHFADEKNDWFMNHSSSKQSTGFMPRNIHSVLSSTVYLLGVPLFSDLELPETSKLLSSSLHKYFRTPMPPESDLEISMGIPDLQTRMSLSWSETVDPNLGDPMFSFVRLKCECIHSFEAFRMRLVILWVVRGILDKCRGFCTERTFSSETVSFWAKSFAQVCLSQVEKNCKEFLDMLSDLEKEIVVTQRNLNAVNKDSQRILNSLMLKTLEKYIYLTDSIRKPLPL